MQIIDLSHEFNSDMPVYPGDALPRLEQMVAAEDAADEDIVHFKLTTGLHVGTHIDAPLHMIRQGKLLSDIAPERFMGQGILLDVRGKQEIDDDLLSKVDLKRDGILLVMTGWDQHWRTERYYQNFPVLTPDFAKVVVRSGVKIIGLDTPSPDVSPFGIHRILLGAEVLIIENLLGLERLQGMKKFEVIALPPKLKAEASLVRVVARQLTV